MARQPQQQRFAPPSAKADMSMSAPGRVALADREGLGGRSGNEGGYYDDSADNCTVGIGTLVHYDPCTPEELNRLASPTQNQAAFDARARAAEDAVRHGVPHKALNQNHYDALASGASKPGRGMRGAFGQADRGNDAGVADEMRRNVLIYRHDAQGHPAGSPTVSPRAGQSSGR